MGDIHLAWKVISKAVLESDAFKNQACFDSEYLGRRGGMVQWWNAIKQNPVMPYQLDLESGRVVRIPGKK